MVLDVVDFDEQQEAGDQQRPEDNAPKSEQRDAQDDAEDDHQRMGVGRLFHQDDAAEVVDVGNHEDGSAQQDDPLPDGAGREEVDTQRNGDQRSAQHWDEAENAGQEGPEQDVVDADDPVEQGGRGGLGDHDDGDADGVAEDGGFGFAADQPEAFSAEGDITIEVALHVASGGEHEVEQHQHQQDVGGETVGGIDQHRNEAGEEASVFSEQFGRYDLVTGDVVDFGDQAIEGVDDP